MDLTIVKTALLIAGAYLLGSVPAAYIAGRLVKGIDLREYGSGTVSGSMVWEHVGRGAIFPVVLFDLGKVALPIWVALQLGLGQPVAVAAGLAATIGHNWPVFLGFRGGRGIGGFFVILLFIFPWGAAWVFALVVIGFLVGDSAPFALLALATLPLLSRLIGGPSIVLPASIAIVLVALVKRLEANRRPLPPPGPESRRVVVRRLLLDRDIASHRKWIDREPDARAPDNAAQEPAQGATQSAADH